MTTRSDITSSTDIHTLVHTFYDAVRSDAQLAPIFASRISDDAWPAHLARMCQFWGHLLLQQHDYHGNPLRAHIGLPLVDQHFDQWLVLWERTVSAHFDGPVATEAIEKARNIASVFRSRLIGIPITLPS